MLRGLFRQRSMGKVYVLRSNRLPAPLSMPSSTLKRPAAAQNTFLSKKPKLSARGTTTFGSIKRRFCNKVYNDYMTAVPQAAGTGFTHKYKAEWLIGIPVFLFSSWIIIYEKRDTTVEISILAARSWERSVFFFIFFAGAAKTVCSTLEPAILTSLIDSPLRSSVIIAARVFAKGYMSAFLCLALFSAIFSTLSFRETARNKKKKNPNISELLVDVTCQSYDIAASLFVTAFPLYVLGAMVGSPLFVLANRAHWSKQLAQAQTYRTAGFMGSGV